MAKKTAKAKTVPAGSSNHRRRSPWVRRFKLTAAVLFVLVSVTGLIFGARFFKELKWAEKEIAKIDMRQAELIGEPTVMVSADGKVLFRAQVEYRKPVKFNDLPKVVIDATLAAEDERFYDHKGFDFVAGARAIVTNVRERRAAEGASTITMQLVKLLYTGREKAMERKIKDIALAYHLERIKTKDEILKLYLNTINYGSGAYGISAAASVYFGKTLDQLTVAEAALLSRIPQRPSANNPFDNPDTALEKRNIVLSKMRELNMINEAAYDEAVNTPLKLKPRQFASGSRIINSPYFVNYVLAEIRERHPDIDVTSGGYRIETTLDTRMQDAAEDSVNAVVKKYRRRDITTAAFVCIDDEGRVKAMVGGVDYDRNQYNVVNQGRRQPGSAMKPFVYAAALSTGTLGFYESISNEPYYIETPSGKKRWPKGGGKGGSVSVTSALAMSINVPAVRVMEKVGPQTAVNYARDVFGFQSKLDPVLALVLGSSAVSPLELAQGYSVFMLHGDRATPFGIKRIICPDGRIIDDFGPRIYRDLLDPRVCEFMDGALRKVVTSGTARKAGSIPNARGKTGTTSDHRDAWFCGYTNNLVGIGWVANEQFEGGRSKYLPMDGVFGGQVTIEIWSQFMKRALRYFDDSKEHGGEIAPSTPTVETDAVPMPEEDPVDESPGPVPDDVPGDPGPDETAPDGTTGNPDGAGEAIPNTPRTSPPATTPQIPPSTEPATTEATSSVEICVDSGLRATPYCPETVTRRVPKNALPGRCKQHGPRVTLLSRLKSD